MKTPLPTDIFKVGQILNNTYEIKGVLGRGGTGEAYLACNQINNREVAIKALNAQFSGNDDYVELMKREDQMRSIRHDAVVRYIEVSKSDDGHVFLVMDYIEGPSLNGIMTEKRMAARDLLIVAHRVLQGLDATHAEGIIHRDLSPDNIILANESPEQATIIDFGIAKDTATGARTIVGNGFAGKYEYAAPEQLEGRVGFQTDIYGLGATLLAAWRGTVPDFSTMPAEIVRQKAQPLDTEGVPDPLKELIDWTTNPDMKKRPANATEAITWLDGKLRPNQQGEVSNDLPKKRWGRIVLATACVVGLAAALLWNFDAFEPELPVASPYEFLAANDPNGNAVIKTHAPDEATAELLRGSFRDVTGVTPVEGSVTLAQGMPSPGWALAASELLKAAYELEAWQISVTDMSAQVTGVASSSRVRAEIAEVFAAQAQSNNMSVEADLVAGPVMLAVQALTPELAGVATCGALALTRDKDATFALFDDVTIVGDVANVEDALAIQSRLEPLIGDRQLKVETRVLNNDLCAIRAVLPQVAAQTVSVRLGHGDTGEDSLTGVFSTGDNPVVDIQMPENIADASLWVMVVDNTGKVFHVLPNVYDTENQVDALGEVVAGIRRIRVLWPVSILAQDPKKLAIQVTEGDYGKSEVIAILSTEPLFDIRRPTEESVASVAEALGEVMAQRSQDILGVAYRIIDARP
ncbi:serine/threonine protein kinase [uncultured Shimia sp.]|uniref:serine/threonine protein kinase n=1 Tax=uncultured Shimia sp. TaxID=573152 RepID=UPI0025D25D29|nr:serine/threonine protein kinase [uncultured Shimia sp.]